MRILCVLSQYAYGKAERGENYDYVHFVPALARMGHEVEFFDSGDRSRHSDFADLNTALLQQVVEFRPDVIFCVLMHYEIWSETLDLIRAESPALVINWGTDDSWKFTQASQFFAKYVDLHVTTDAAAEKTARSLGLDNVFLSQWAASGAALREPLLSRECRYDVSFVGSMYGYRAEWISALRQSGISVSCFGHGTENGVVEAGEIPEIYRGSRISLNFSGAGHNLGAANTANDRQIKARTFEVPGAGGFLLTESAPGLDRYYVPDKEIGVFTSPNEMIEKVRYFLSHSNERDRIACAGHARTKEAHTYEIRLSDNLTKLETLVRARRDQPWTLSAAALVSSVQRHRHNTVARWIRPVLVLPLSFVFGKMRGPRAARRFLFELSWRFAGAATYSARGLPGRLFYRES